MQVGKQARRELLSSIRELYGNREYSDIIINTGLKSFDAHRVIVCPRSEYLAEKYRDAAMEMENSDHSPTPLDLRDDDPQAVEMVMQYMYHLDYPLPTAEGLVRVAPTTNGLNGTHTNGTNGILADDERASRPNGTTNGTVGSGSTRSGSVPSLVSRPPTSEPPEALEAPEAPLDEIMPASVLQKGKGKKKKRKKTDARPPTADLASPAEEATPDKWDEMVAADEAAMQAVREEEEPAPPAPPAEEAQGPSSNLTVHAKVYELSKKYGMESLRTLALSKFETEATDQWETEDFLLAAREVYTASLDKPDRRLKDMITEIVYQHRGVLLQRAEVQEAIKGLGLDWDVLMMIQARQLSQTSLAGE